MPTPLKPFASVKQQLEVKLTPEDATAFKVHLPENPSLTILAYSLESLREDHTKLRTRVDIIHNEIGLFSKKVDDLMHITSLVDHGVKIAVNFKPSNLNHVTIVAYHIIQLSSSNPHFI